LKKNNTARLKDPAKQKKFYITLRNRDQTLADTGDGLDGQPDEQKSLIYLYTITPVKVLRISFIEGRVIQIQVHA
jgi:hypothetical protein